jgi:ABC-type Fe3+ transport system substrate-binding protein
VAVGVTVLIAAGQRQSQRPALMVVEPQDVIGAEAEVYGVLKGTRASEAAQMVLDWLGSPQAEARFRAWRKTILPGAADRLFAIDPARAVAERAVNLAKFKNVV